MNAISPPLWKHLTSDPADLRPMVSNSLILNFKSRVRPDYGGMDMSAMSVKDKQLAPYKKMDWNNPFTDEMVFVRTEVYLSGNQNVPIETSEDFDLCQYRESFVEGFKNIYSNVLNHANGFETILDVFKNCRVRVLMRNTVDYSKLLMESYHPKLLFYSNEFKTHFDYLMEDNIRIDLIHVFESEKADIYEGNIPVFFTKSDGHAIYDSHGRKMNIAIEKTGLECVKEILHNVLSEKDLNLQLKMIEYSFIGFGMNEALEGIRRSSDSHIQEVYKPSVGLTNFQIVNEFLKLIQKKSHLYP